MYTIAPADLLQLWEIGNEQTLIEKSILLLAKILPGQTTASIANLSIGERDEILLTLREHLFGTRLANTAVCPRCANVAEWEINSRDIHLQQVSSGKADDHFLFIKDDYKIVYRLPNSNDLLRVTRMANSYLSDSGKLLTDCILEIRQNDKPLSAENLSSELLQELDSQMGDNDPQADIGMLLDCPSCANRWEAKFDIMSYLWLEIDAWATHFLHEIYLLASSFGWAEKDILNMSPRRRKEYLKLIQA